MLAAGGAAMLLAGQADASDKRPCPANLICANKPSSIMDLITGSDPSAQVGVDKEGRPKVTITNKAYKYTIYFADCDGKVNCSALTFSSDFTKDPTITLAFVNGFNKGFRVPKASLEDDGTMFLQMEVSTVGGISRENFLDWKGWWDAGLNDFADYVDKATGKTTAAPKK